MSDFFLLGAWLVSAGCAVVIPLLRWNASRAKYYSYYGRYNQYEMQQRAYEQAQNNYNNNNNGYNNYNYSCKWYQWSCRKSANNWYYYQQASGDGNGQAFYAPNWYRMINGKMEDDEREREEMGATAAEASGTLKFVYVWTLFMFISLVLFGAVVLWKRNPGGPTALFVMLVVFGQLALLELLLLGQGVIVTDMRDMEDSIYGWYGQLGVLMAYTNFWYIIFSFGFAILFGLVSCCSRARNGSSAAGRGDENGSSWTSRNSKAAGLDESLSAGDNGGASNLMNSINGVAMAAVASIGAFMARYRKKDLGTQEPFASSYSVPSIQTTTPYPQSTSMRSIYTTTTTASGAQPLSGFQTSCMDIGDQIADYTTSADPPSCGSTQDDKLTL